VFSRHFEKIFNKAAYGEPVVLLANRFRYKWVNMPDEKKTHVFSRHFGKNL
jgi:hypothetical protein